MTPTQQSNAVELAIARSLKDQAAWFLALAQTDIDRDGLIQQATDQVAWADGKIDDLEQSPREVRRSLIAESVDRFRQWGWL